MQDRHSAGCRPRTAYLGGKAESLILRSLVLTSVKSRPSGTTIAPAVLIEVPATGQAARLQARDGTWDAPTCGIAAGYLQANLIVLPAQYAKDFAILCARNPVPCPLLASSASPGDFQTLKSCMAQVPDGSVAKGVDVRRDAPRFNVYQDGRLVGTNVPSVEQYWSQDHVAFLIGCSYSFEAALINAGLPPPQVTYGRNVPMYRTTIPLCPAGVFTGSTYVVSMRMYRGSEMDRVRNITRPYVATHGEPIAWGWDGMRWKGDAYR